MTDRDLSIFGPACPSSGTVLCRMDDLISAGENLPGLASLDLTFRQGRDHLHILLLRRDDEVRAFVDRCPHAFARLSDEKGQAWQADVFTGTPYIHCTIHGALFRFEDGLCIHGPCLGKRLQQIPVTCVDRHILIG